MRKSAISLSLNKEMAKENQLKGLMPLRNPPCVFAGEAFASQHDAKRSFFRFCECSLKKAALTQMSRNPLL